MFIRSLDQNFLRAVCSEDPYSSHQALIVDALDVLDL